MKPTRLLLALALFALAAPARAESSGSSGPHLGWQGWGVRVGLADDPDQVVGGVQFNLGEVARRLRFQPDVVIGAGDDATSLVGTAPLYYRFRTHSGLVPYAGGGLALGWFDFDEGPGNGDDSEFEIGARATGGLEWSRGSGRAFFVELSFGFGDINDVQAVAAWEF